VEADQAVEIWVDGAAVRVCTGATILEACDAAGHYVPRLCEYPDLTSECGLCVVRLEGGPTGDGSIVFACATPAASDMVITTDGPRLRALRLERLAAVLSRHPHICLSCPDRDGCARDECSYGNPAEARCCDEFGRCELGKLVRWTDPALLLPRKAVAVTRDAEVEGRIRRESGLCIGCGRCVRVCEDAPDAGQALMMVPVSATGAAPACDGAEVPAVVALPKRGTLRASGCTFCGQCVLVCPAGALRAPGEAGVRWLAGRRERSGLSAPAPPPEERQPFTRESVAAVLCEAGVFQLFDRQGGVLRISGVADLRRGLAEALADPASEAVACFQVECDPLFTQRESQLLAQYSREQGRLPPGNDLGDELFADDWDG
jgi:predicted molibdopterin-dependent oxidoreductase YjgC